MIKAEVHTDNYVHEVDFDAAPWFEQASQEDILALVDCGWGGDYPADAVAEHHPSPTPDMTALFDYLDRIAGTRRACGFEVHVEADEAVSWLAVHRPDWIRPLRLETYLEDEDEETGDEEDEDGDGPSLDTAS